MITRLRNYLFNKPAFILSGRGYIRYLSLIGKLFNYGRFRIKVREPSKDNEIAIFEVSIKNEKIFTTAGYRCSRFLKGFHHAGERIWKRNRADRVVDSLTINTVIDIGANVGEFSFYCIIQKDK